ncbi:hypothetical protein [Aureibacillus halotolerans]|uniref:Uncharacterized protein n=1 Tax=Aureibacillus halotolerans TaxID=1508390 RepID=A0A4R6TWP6_9BACI|nr:hypothetical protein [Aureibacillus halotolerans]TDQ38278.1 hypothetical protein EV213_11016 [Aureibacillus halotolerans]
MNLQRPKDPMTRDDVLRPVNVRRSPTDDFSEMQAIQETADAPSTTSDVKERPYCK